MYIGGGNTLDMPGVIFTAICLYFVLDHGTYRMMVAFS